MEHLDQGGLEQIAELICGDQVGAPTYRSGGELTRFFARAGLPQFAHDGSTRKWWTLSALQSCTADQLDLVVKRLGSPKEYGGNPDKTEAALTGLNRVLAMDGYRVSVAGVDVEIERIDPTMPKAGPSGRRLQPLACPDFEVLGLEPGLPQLLRARWVEAERCVQAEAHLASVILMGSLLEGLLLSVIFRFPAKAGRSRVAPKDKTGAPKAFGSWTLSEMIDVAHSESWIDLDVQRFAHALRQFRNLVHPHEQLKLVTVPDRDTSAICWLVEQAAVNDLAVVLA